MTIFDNNFLTCKKRAIQALTIDLDLLNLIAQANPEGNYKTFGIYFGNWHSNQNF